MGDFWDFNCPKFVDFTTPIDDEDNADEWFDMDHETDETYYTPVANRKSRGEQKRVLSEVVLSSNNIRQEYSGCTSNAKRKPSVGPLRVPSNRDENNPPEPRPNSKRISQASRVSKYTSKPQRSCVEVGAGESIPVEHLKLDNLKIKPEVFDLPAASSASPTSRSQKIAKYTPRRSNRTEVGAGEAVPSQERKKILPAKNTSKLSSSCEGDSLNVSESSENCAPNVKGIKRLSSTPKSGGAIPKRRSLGKKVLPCKHSSLTKSRSLTSKASAFASALRRSPRLLLEKLSKGSRSKPTTPVSAVTSAETLGGSDQRVLRRAWSKPSLSSDQNVCRFAVSKSPKLSSNKPKKVAPENSSTLNVRQQLALRRKMAVPAVKAVVPLKAVALKSHPVQPCTTQGESVREFASTLRKFDEQPVNTAPKASITKPVPFNLTEAKKRKYEDGGVFRSMAEQVAAFQAKTPQRYRTRSKQASQSLTASPESVKSPRVTIPHTPKLVTRYRVRPATVLSREELEQQELERIQKNQFKAHPVNLRAIQQHQLKEVKPKSPTKLEPFNLTAPQRLHSSLDNIPTEKYEFRARPVPHGLFDAPKGLNACKEKPVAIQATPPLRWKDRLRRRSKSFSEKRASAKPKPIKANPVPHHGVPFKIELNKKMTVPEPFSFDELDRKRMVHKGEKIKEMVEQEVKLREFHAQPMPSLEPSGIPEKQPKPPTAIQPFQFAYNDTASLRVDKWKREMEEELKRQKELAVFKAGPNKVIYEEPFIPERSSKPLTVVADIELNTQRRAVDREEFDQFLKHKESELEALRLQREEEAAERENQIILKMREEAVHKANPVRSYKPLDIQPSTRPLTVPQSPCFIAKRSKYSNS